MTWYPDKVMEKSKPSDPFHDYCLWPYSRPADIMAGGLRTSALLYKTFEIAGLGRAALAYCDAVQKRWGKFQTVWGVKWADGKFSWEFYFYDYARDDRKLGMTDYLRTTTGIIKCDLEPDDTLPYFMFSVEIDEHVLNGSPLDQIDIYMGNPGSSVSSGICYGLTATQLEMRNFYFFFSANRERQQIIDKLNESIHLPYQNTNLNDLLWPEMKGVETIVLSNKRFNDGIYFSRIRATQLEYFLHRLKYPKELIQFLSDQKGKFDHHLFDVGWDYDVDQNGTVTPQKGSFYGVL
tara:strand:- start:4380 stop:5258 length:879 start_codon:yes stop_codon:yes gene_type:complete